MKRTITVIIALIVSMLPMTTAHAAVKKAKSPLSCEYRTFTSSPGPRFNDPEDPATRMEVMGPIIESINSAGCGQTIRVAMYSISRAQPGPDFADALIAAHRRGVVVKALMDAHSDNAVWQSMVDELGNDPRASSFAAMCPGGCLTHFAGSSLHAKYYMFSGGSEANRTVTVSSANPTSAQVGTAWNSSATVKGNVALYNSYARHFASMARGAVNGPGPLAPDHYNSASAKAARKLSPPSYQWPKARSRSDTWVDFLNNIKAPATVNIAMFQWTSHGKPGGRNYLELPKKLVSLARTGVKIHILITAAQVDDSVQSYLRNRPNIHVHDTSRGTDANGNALHYTHDKYMMINGTYAGKAGSRLVFVGSSNWTSNGVWHNDETALKLVGRSTYDTFMADWRKQYDRCCGTAGRESAAEKRAEDTAREIPVDPRQARE
ncbi:phosphatidylserine/phosphatidylglycerophosphate/cardiolipin synthase family protein [Streptomyces sp. WMMB 322]|uniref:phospholipase D-like domain-containing protein n=1 Tax=Streptomyces sp. WMMB 322 TaxID=1286821 RepID=UPI0006E25C2C|nr:phospholipase D-like domain-containing protein [Streptomyces sp. WMMB 322]SCK44406.1 Phosphatidylserine/phosphatidylglycerophosphate/cardiolipin synthase [Streptomyces sp. WMMB 322]